MPAYICVTHALSRREETDVFCRSLSRYGFRFACIHEQTDPLHRTETLTEASLLIALTCPADEASETVAADIRRAMGRGMPVLCVSMGENRLDDRFCSPEGGAALIPAPTADTPDRRTVSLFIHRLFIRHLARLAECFSPVRCVEDAYGKVITAAVAAHKGDVAACYALGRAYEEGDSVPKLEVEAARWIALAAEGGINDARIRMGELYLTGRGTECNPEAAYRLFDLAAREGDLRGEYRKGLCYLRGLGVLKDPERACECLRKASDGGYAPAAYCLGLLYQSGEGVPRDHRAAVALVYKSCLWGAEAEDASVGAFPSLLGDRTGEGVSCITMRQMRRTRLQKALLARSTANRSRQKGLSVTAFARSRVTPVGFAEADFIRRATEEAELSEVTQPTDSPDAATAVIPAFSVDAAAVTLGRMLAEGDPAAGIPPHPTRAMVWYRYALMRGNTEAAYRLGDAYRRGFGVPASPARAFACFRLAAARGDERGLFALGVCFEQGIGVEADPHRAFLNYERAALAGYVPAENNLGGCYEHGIGVVRDVTAAAEWYARAAAEGLPEAACRLGLCYEYGRGVEPDLMKAFRLYETAAEGGDPHAAYRLGLCYDRGMRPKEKVLLTSADGEVQPHSGPADRTEEIVAPAPDYGRAVRLFETAAEGGVADAAYALALCYACGRGVRRDEERCLSYMNRAADGGCVAACYSLGLYHMGGQALVRSVTRAVSRFADAAALWEKETETVQRESVPTGVLAQEGLTTREAAGAALYMLGYCALYGLGDIANPAVSFCERSLTPTERAELAAVYFEKAARADHVGALTALGDLYAFGLRTPAAATAEDEALRYYMEAVRLGEARECLSDAANDSPIDAFMSLAERSMAVADAAAAEGDEGSAELARVRTWRSLAGASEEGSLDAAVSMAACAYHGYGTPQNFDTALWFLDKAAKAEEGRVTASLWLGDLYYAGKEREPSPTLADEAYLRAIALPDTVSECGAYTLRERREARAKRDRAARAEACYRIATLRAVHFASGEDIRESFPYLVRAVLMGHTAAREDLARMYAFESTYIEATSPKERRSTAKWPTPAGVHARRRLNSRDSGSVTPRDSRAGRSHEGWMTDYYTALWPEPILFGLGMRATSAPTDRPEYVSAAVTPAMLAAALNYLGDCLFYGEGLPVDPAAAASCYREVADMRIPVPRGQSTPAGQIWAQYSYGWCLLHGKGVPEDPRTAVRYLTRASRTHAEACYALGECYEGGIGVDAADEVEAYKYYRKAMKLGFAKAETKVKALEKRLRAEA